MNRSDFLFVTGDLGQVLRGQDQRIEQAAQAIPADHALAHSAEELAAELVEGFRIEPIVLDEAGLTVSYRDEKVDVSRDPMRAILDRGQPFHIPGTEITYHVPFTGDPELFKMHPSHFTSNPPVGKITDNELRISITAPIPVPDDMKGRLDRELHNVREYMGWVNADLADFNARVDGTVVAACNRRREKVVADHELVASFGVPVRRADAPETYSAPPVRRTVTRTPASRGTPPKPLEPVLPSEEYEHILAVARQMGTVLERSPKAFAGMGEEDLRQQFLVQLNGQYEGDATGETFNFEGKTDILIRRKGQNIFVAECKFWSGPKKLSETIDQLLGYASWRDTKTAIFIFNRGRELSKVLAQISPTVTAHPNTAREVPYGGETDFRFIIRHRDDPERELTLTVLAFEVPA